MSRDSEQKSSGKAKQNSIPLYFYRVTDSTCRQRKTSWELSEEINRQDMIEDKKSTKDERAMTKWRRQKEYNIKEFL